MRTQLLFDNVSASINSTSAVLDFGEQDARFIVQATKSGANGSPKIIIEESIDQTVWTAMEDTETWNPYTELIDTLSIKDNYFMGKYFRVRIEPNGTTTGTVWAKIGYKTKP